MTHVPRFPETQGTLRGDRDGRPEAAPPEWLEAGDDHPGIFQVGDPGGGHLHRALREEVQTIPRHHKGK